MDCNIISDCTVSDFISDHRVLHASLQCILPHPVRKQITVRALRRIKDDALAEDLDRFYVDQGCVDVDIHSLLGSKKNTVLPEYTSSFTLASTINMFFID